MADNKKNTETGTFNRKLFTDHLLITFAIMLITWVPCVILGINGMTRESHAWINIPYLIGGFSPMIASYIALKKNGEITGFKDWLKHIFDFKHSALAYALALILPILQALLICLIGGYEKGAPIYMLIPLTLAMIVGGGLEETGWRYITFPELNKKMGFAASAAVTAVIWWLWHLPLFFMPGVNQYQKNFFIFGIMVLAMSFMLAAIRKKTGSVWLCVLCHGLINALMEVFIYDVYGNILATAITTASMIAISMIVAHKQK